VALARQRTLPALSGRRVALWGAAAGALLPAVAAAVLAGGGAPPAAWAGACALAGAGAVLGTGLATASLRAARRGPGLASGSGAGLARR
jgi:hypothetical protein